MRRRATGLEEPGGTGTLDSKILARLAGATNDFFIGRFRFDDDRRQRGRLLLLYYYFYYYYYCHYYYYYSYYCPGWVRSLHSVFSLPFSLTLPFLRSLSLFLPPPPSLFTRCCGFFSLPRPLPAFIPADRWRRYVPPKLSTFPPR